MTNKNKKILLVEDDDFLVDIYTTKLYQAGFTVDVAKDGEQALSKIKEEKPDLVLLDIVLPKIDGWQVLKKIKTDPKTKDVKVVVLSNLSEKEVLEKLKDVSFDKYLLKASHTPSQLLREIEDFFK